MYVYYFPTLYVPFIIRSVYAFDDTDLRWASKIFNKCKTNFLIDTFHCYGFAFRTGAVLFLNERIKINGILYGHGALQKTKDIRESGCTGPYNNRRWGDL